MAQLAWSEKDEAKLVGIRPSIAGDKIFKEDDFFNDTRIMYTVPANKYFWLFGWHCSVNNNSGALASGGLYIRDSGSATQYYLGKFLLVDQGHEVVIGSPFVPIELEVGWDIVAFSADSDFHIIVSIYGIEGSV